jgi:hypothetical protein
MMRGREIEFDGLITPHPNLAAGNAIGEANNQSMLRIVTASTWYHEHAPYLDLGVTVQAGVASTGIWQGVIGGYLSFVVLGVNSTILAPKERTSVRVRE